VAKPTKQEMDGAFFALNLEIQGTIEWMRARFHARASAALPEGGRLWWTKIGQDWTLAVEHQEPGLDPVRSLLQSCAAYTRIDAARVLPELLVEAEREEERLFALTREAAAAFAAVRLKGDDD